MRSDNSGCYQTQGVKSEKERNAFDLLHPPLNIFSFFFFFCMSSAHSQAVQVCELVTVHKAEEDWTRRRKKKAKQVAELYPHAFTGKEK